jgi:hypothetical protein
MRRIQKFIKAKEEPHKSRKLAKYKNDIRGQDNCIFKSKTLYASTYIK